MTDPNHSNEKIPKGQIVAKWSTLGMAIFSGVGVAFSVIFDNPGYIGIGSALGLVIGAAYGRSIEKGYEQEGRIRELTDQEKNQKRSARNIALILFILGIGALIMFILVSTK